MEYKDYYKQVDKIFGTIVTQEVYGKNAKEIVINATEKMKAFEKKLSLFRDDSIISEINRSSGECMVDIDSDTLQIIKTAKQYSELTDGLFDITIAPLVKAWGINTPNARVLEDNEIEQVLELVDYNKVLLLEEEKKIFLKQKGAMIDLGGIAKGYIADKIIDYYKEAKVERAFVNLGGNVKVLNTKKEFEPWKIGIKYPSSNPDEIIGFVKVRNESVVTSGDYERFFEYKGEKYNHILNPKDGKPMQTDLRSVTVISDSSLECDALSTPLFMMGLEEACEFVKNNTNIKCIFITKDDKIIMTGGVELFTN
jgi:thiamine biosynthesis lipoprotein